MGIKLKNSETVTYNKGKRLPGLIVMWILILAASVAFLSQYGHFKERASVEQPDFLSDSEFLYEIYQANTVLYKQLQEQKAGEPIVSADLYLEAEGRTAEAGEFEEYFDFAEDTPLSYAGKQLDAMLEDWNTDFNSMLAAHADYQMTDGESGESVANTEWDLQKLGTEEADALADFYIGYIKLQFDVDGLLKHVWVRGEDADALLENVKRVIKSRYLERSLYENLSYSAYGKVNWEDDIYYGTKDNVRQMRMQVDNTPKNCSVCYAFTAGQLEELKASSSFFQSQISAGNYFNSGIQYPFYILLAILGIAALLLPLWKGYHLHEGKLLPLHMEVVVFLLFAIFLILGDMAAAFVKGTMSDKWDVNFAYRLHAVLPGLSKELASGIVLCGNLLFLILAFTFWYALVTALSQVYIFGVRGYVRKRCFCCRVYRILRVVKRRKAARLKRELWEADLEQSRDGVLLKVIVANFLILSLISLFWVFGIFLLAGYSVLLYIFLRNYIHDIQEDYEQVLMASRSVATGNLQTEFEEDWGMFDSCKSELQKIQTGFSKAVQEEVKSQRMRTELITNVSHDLKTPLTAIITYISLLQEENVTEAQQKEYLDVLERKSLRLKILIEDLFELSKASSGSVTFHPERVDICHLMRQVYLEYEDNAKAADLVFRFQMPEEKIYLMLDGEKTYRIFDNLYGNILKYAMPGTRVYVRAWEEEGEIQVELKNISGSELPIAPERLTERFVRGDSARSTEGSGLGLAIAKTLTELQNGRMSLAVDGDLFKVTLTWKALAK